MAGNDAPHDALFINKERLKQLQKWAAIAPQSNEEDLYLIRELNNQLNEMVIKVLDPALDSSLENIMPTHYGVNLNGRCASMRDDIVEPWPDPEALTEMAPRSRDGYFVVPVNKHESLK